MNTYSPKKLTEPLKNDGWKTILFLLFFPDFSLFFPLRRLLEALEASAIVRVIGSLLERFEKDGYEVLKHDVFVGILAVIHLCVYIVCFVIDDYLISSM